MNNIKYQTFNAGRAGSGRVNLATGKLKFVHEERSNSSTLPISISHVYLSENANQESPYGKGFKLNLHQTLSHREGDDTKWRYTDGNGVEHKFKERFYCLENDEKQFVTPSQVKVSQDGKLTFGDKEVFLQLRTKSGLALETELKKDFIDSDKIEARHEELVQIDEDIKTLKLQAKQIEIEYESLESELKTHQFKDEQTNLTQADIGTSSSSTKATVQQIQDAIVAQTGAYNSQIRKSNQSSFRINATLNGNFVNNPTSVINQSNFNNYKYDITSPSSNIFDYNDPIGKNYEHFSRMADAVTSGAVSGGVTVGGVSDIQPRSRAAMFIFRDKFIEDCDRITQKIRDWSHEIEKLSKQYQDTNLVTAKSNILKLQKDMMAIRTGKDEDGEFSSVDLFAALTTLRDAEIKITRDKLKMKEFIRERLVARLPVNYILDGDIVFGFNRLGNLAMIFDSYDNQVAIVYEKNRIERVIDSQDREVTFEYGAEDQLVAIVDSQNRKTKFEYDNGKLCAVEYPNGEKSIFAYDGDLLDEMIPPSGIGIKLHYDENKKVVTIAQKTYLFDSQTQTICEDIPVYYENTISTENNEMQLSGVYTQKDLFLISYDTVGKNTTVSELIGESGPILVEKGIKEISYFNQNWGLIAEYRSVIKAGAGYIPDKIVFYDEEKDNYEFVYEQTKFYPNIDYGQQIQDYITNPNPLELEGVKSEFTAGDWIFTEFDEETGNIKAEHYNEKTLLGGIKSEMYKTFKHDVKTNLLVEETVHEKFAGVAKEPLSTRYEYNKQGKLIRTIDAKGIVSVIVYDKRGNAVKNVTYHKDTPGAKFCQERETAENGQVLAEVNEFCESKTKFKYVDGTNLVCSADVDGNITAFGHDLYTDNVLEITSTADDDVNSIVYKYTNDYLTKLTCGNTNVEYTYDKWGRRTSIQIGNIVHVIFHYEMIDKYDANNPCGNIVTTQYANGDAFKTISDKFGNVLEIQRKQGDNWNVVVKYTYDAENQLVTVTDDVAEQITMFDYDSNGNLRETKQGDVKITPRLSSDGKSQFVSYKVDVNDSQMYTQNLDKFGELKSLVLPTDDIIEIEKDGLGRLSKTHLSKVVPPVPKEYTSVSFAIDDWETIIAVAEAGLSKQCYNVGDEKNCFVGGEPVKYVILGFDHDILADGSGKKSGMTIGLKNLLQASHAMNSTATNNGGWNVSAMRSTVMPSIFAALPSELQPGIKTVDKYTGNGLLYPNMEILTSQDKLFLFSTAEITATPANVWPGEGQIYEYWTTRDTAADRVKTGNIVNPGRWWTRSATTGSSSVFNDVMPYGGTMASSAETELGVCFGFAIGEETAEDFDTLHITGNEKILATGGKAFDYSCSYSYLQKGDHASNLVSRVTQKIGNETIRTRYVYDNSSNISEIRDGYNNLISKYEYDGLNRLVHENDTEFGYDNNGNILYKKTGDDVIKYEYDGGRLMSYNGEVFEYDVLGNPTTYRDKQMTWDFRNLSEYKGVQFKYAANGLRIKKTCGQNITEYFWAGETLIAEQRAQDFIEYTQGIEGIAGFRLNNVPYWYVKNLQGDVISVYDNVGECAAEYKYDAFGNCEIVTSVGGIAELNAIRYRGYYYDTETGLYYMTTRYYDPQTGRFISSDRIDILDESQYMINGLNLYSYCGSNPIMRSDPSGQAWWKWLVGGLATVAGVVLVATGIGAVAGVGLIVAGGSMLASDDVGDGVK